MRSEFHAVKYDLLEHEDAATLLVAGPRDASKLVYFQTGFPDLQEAFLPLALRVARESACLVGVGCLPEFDRTSILREQGYNFDELVLCFDQALAALRQEATNEAHELILVAHDFGTTPCAIWTNRALDKVSSGDATTRAPSRLVFFDVLPGHAKGGASVYFSVVLSLYQVFFATAFWLHWKVSAIIGKIYFILGMIFIFGIFGRWLNPADPVLDMKQENVKKPSRSMMPYITYPYYWGWSFRADDVLKRAIADTRLPPLDKVRVLYLYGTEKNTMLHDDRGLSLLATTEGSHAVGLHKAGHNLFRANQRLEACFEEMHKFL